MINNALKGHQLPIYGDGKNIRDWIFVEDHCRALLKVLEKGTLGERYNIGGNCEIQNREVVHLICDQLDKRLGLEKGLPRRHLVRHVTDRPGHDRRYAIDTTKIRKELAWVPKFSFDEGIGITIDWYLQNRPWVENILDGTYRDYYKEQYGDKLNEPY
jgi:dTDP-glucose 4,6-dehydratase